MFSCSPLLILGDFHLFNTNWSKICSTIDHIGHHFKATRWEGNRVAHYRFFNAIMLIIMMMFPIIDMRMMMMMKRFL